MLKNWWILSKHFIVNYLKRSATQISPWMKFKMLFVDSPRILPLFLAYSLSCHMGTNMNWWIPIIFAMTTKVSSLMLSMLKMLPIWQMFWSLSWFKHAGTHYEVTMSGALMANSPRSWRLQNNVTSSKYLVMHAFRDHWILVMQYFDAIKIFSSLQDI